MGGIFGGGKKAARKVAKATLKAAEMQAANDRLVAQASQNSMETMLAQSIASDKAAELLAKPQAQIDVQLGAGTDAPTVDETTGKRRTVRQKYSPTRKTGPTL